MYSHKSFQKKSKLAKRRNNYNKSRKSKLIIGGGHGLHKKEGLKIDILPNGIFTELERYMSSDLRESFKYKIARIIIILYEIIKPEKLEELKQHNYLDDVNFINKFTADGLLQGPIIVYDNPHQQNCWFRIKLSEEENPLSVNIKIDRILKQGDEPELYGLDFYVKHKPEQLLKEIFSRFKGDYDFREFTLTYCLKKTKEPLFVVKVEKIDQSGGYKHFKFHIYLVDNSGNEIRPYDHAASEPVSEAVEVEN